MPQQELFDQLIAPQPATPPQQGGVSSSGPVSLYPNNSQRYQDLAKFMAEKQGVDPALAMKLFETESSWNPAAKSPKGAIGLGQLMPSTAARYGVDPTNPIANMHGSLLELKRLMEKYKGDRVRALGAYNAGETNIDNGRMPAETKAYVMKILQGLGDGQPAGLGFETPKASILQPPGLAQGSQYSLAAMFPEWFQKHAAATGLTSQDVQNITRSGVQMAVGADPNAPQKRGFIGGATDLLKGMTSMPSSPEQAGEMPLGGPQALISPVIDVAGRIKEKDYPGAAGSGLTSLMLMGGGEELLRRGLGKVAPRSGIPEVTPRGPQDTSIQDARTSRRLEESKARQAARPAVQAQPQLGAEGPAVQGVVKPGTRVAKTAAREAGTVQRGVPAAQEPSTGRTTGVQPVRRKAPVAPVAPPKPLMSEEDALKAINQGAGGVATPTPQEQAIRARPQEAPPTPEEIAAVKARQTEPAYKLSTDQLGVRWAEDDKGVRVSIPKAIKDSEVDTYAKGALAEQAKGQSAVKAQVPTEPQPLEARGGEKGISPEAVSRPGTAYKVGPSGVTHLGKDIDASLRPGEAVIRKLPNGDLQVSNTNGLTDKEAIEKYGNKLKEAAAPEKPPTKPPEPSLAKGGTLSPEAWQKAARALGIPEKGIPTAASRLSNVYESAKRAGLGEDEARRRVAELAKTIKKQSGVLRFGGRQTALQQVLSRFNVAAGSRMHEIMREKLGDFHKQVTQVEDRLKEAKRFFDTQSQGGHSLAYAFIDHVENGEADRASRGINLSPKLEKRLQEGKAQMTPELQALAMELKGLYQNTRTGIQNLGTGRLSHFIENYFPHLWKEKTGKGVSDAVGSRRPLEGRKGSLKERTIPTTLEGLDKGFNRAHENPIDQALATLHEQNRYITAHKMMQEAKRQGIAKFVKFGAKPLDGWRAIDDKMYTVLQHSPQEKGFIIRGKYYMPEKAAKVLNTYLSPGLRGKMPYDIARGFSNALNQAQLGLSAYHFGTTSVNAIVSQFAQGMTQLAPGKDWTGARAMDGIKKIMSSPIAPARHLVHGVRVAREYLEPGQFQQYAKTARAVSMAGGRIRMESSYKNSSLEGFIRAWNKNTPMGMFGNALPALLEAQAKPIMEWTVPTMKLGAFHDMASDIFAKATTNNWTHEKVRAEMSKAWDSIDNRFGEVVYDNLLWNRAAKDLSHVLVRSVGWNFGTFRELGGGTIDLAKYAKDLAIHPKEAQLSQRAAYTMALPIVVGTIGAIYHYTHTGERPKEMKDYFFPKTGQKTPTGLDERVSLPSYMKDVYAWTNHPLQTALNKGNPGIESVYEMLNNRDFYGKPIRHIDDPFVKKVAKSAAFGAKQLIPFSVQNWTTRQQKTLESTLETGFGIAPASKEIERSDAQNLDVQRRLERKAEGGKQLSPRRGKQTF